MVTLFSTAKPFKGHTAVIQRNALKSWKLLHPDIEIILFGDDEGAAEVCAEFGLRHEPLVERHESGMKYLNCIFDRAEQIARHDCLCYCNCDIIFTPDFLGAIQKLQSLESRFLMVGRRWDTDITEPIDFSAPGYGERLQAKALAANDQKPAYYIDYFAFTRGLYKGKIPPLVIGRVYWDNWLIWFAMDQGATVVDASAVVRAIHQNHDYGYHPKGKEGVWNDELSQSNLRHAGGRSHLRGISDSEKILASDGLKNNPARHWVSFRRKFIQSRDLVVSSAFHPVWFFFLRITRPLRSALGLRSAAVRRSDEKP